jgi:hypothetical protein
MGCPRWALDFDRVWRTQYQPPRPLFVSIAVSDLKTMTTVIGDGGACRADH